MRDIFFRRPGFTCCACGELHFDQWYYFSYQQYH
jgi:hypothetical protein